MCKEKVVEQSLTLPFPKKKNEKVILYLLIREDAFSYWVDLRASKKKRHFLFLSCYLILSIQYKRVVTMNAIIYLKSIKIAFGAARVLY